MKGTFEQISGMLPVIIIIGVLIVIVAGTLCYFTVGCQKSIITPICRSACLPLAGLIKEKSPTPLNYINPATSICSICG